MSVIIIDGPEKAGKTTLIGELVKKFQSIGISSERVHWGPVDPDDRAYSSTLKEHTASIDKVWIWDRGWPSEYVYGRLLGRDRRMNHDPWLGEWLHGRAVQANGLRVILTGPHYHILQSLRDKSDLQVDVEVEQALYASYGHKFGWLVLQNSHTEVNLNTCTQIIFLEFMMKNKVYKATSYAPPNWCGPRDAEIVVIGEKLSESVIPGGWLPFTNKFTTMLGREFGDDAFKVAWTNVETCDPYLLHNRSAIITCGWAATNWYDEVRAMGGGGKARRVVNIPHPAYMYRFKNEKTTCQLETVRQVIQSLKPL